MGQANQALSNVGLRFAQAARTLDVFIENVGKLSPLEALETALASRALPSKCALPNLNCT